MKRNRRKHRRSLTLEHLDQRRCLAADLGFEAPVWNLDVNHDGAVTPTDALLIVNELNAPRLATAAEGEASPSTTDVNQDGQTTPIDAVIVINDINDNGDSTTSEPVDNTPTTDGNTDTSLPPSTDTDPTTPDPSDSTDETASVPIDDTSGNVDPAGDGSSTDSSTGDTSDNDTDSTDDPTTADPTGDDSGDDATDDDSATDDSATDDSTDDGGCQRPRVLETVFADKDANGDGQLTEDEVSAEVWGRISGADANGDGGVSLTELTDALGDAPRGPHGSPHGPGGHHEGPGERPGNIFERFDANDDGLLTEDEVSAEIWTRLSAADADASGSVSTEELAAFRPTPHSPAEHLFTRLDANSDGSLTEDEVPTEVWDRLSAADTDASGSLSLEELAAFRPAPSSPIDQIFSRLDTDGDGSLTEDEVPEGVWERISGADTDADGGVTKDELLAALPTRPAEPPVGHRHAPPQPPVAPSNAAFQPPMRMSTAPAGRPGRMGAFRGR